MGSADVDEPARGSTNGSFAVYLERFLEYVVLALMTGLAVLVVVAVVFRKAGASLVWYDELASITLAWLTYYGACLATMKYAHIGFPKLVDAAPPKARLLLVALREIVVVGFFLTAAWAGWQVQRVLVGTYLVSMPAIPTGLAHSVIPVGALLFVVAELAVMRRRFEPVAPRSAAVDGAHENAGKPPATEGGGQ